MGRRHRHRTTVNADPKLIDALNSASSLELFQLSTLIERMLADPRRIIAVCTNLCLGQTVRFLDWREGEMRNGKVVAMKDTKVTLHEEGSRREWTLPYAAVEPPVSTEARPTAEPDMARAVLDAAARAGYLTALARDPHDQVRPSVAVSASATMVLSPLTALPCRPRSPPSR